MQDQEPAIALATAQAVNNWLNIKVKTGNLSFLFLLFVDTGRLISISKYAIVKDISNSNRLMKTNLGAYLGE
jgi:hypothetical protein